MNHNLNLEIRKYNLINWIINVRNEDIIEYLEMIQSEKSEDWNDLPKNVQEGIEEAIKQADNGRLLSHKEQY